MGYGDLRGMTRQRVRENYCPKCGAAPGEPCHGVGKDARPRVANHPERRSAAKVAKRKRAASYGRGGGDIWNRLAYQFPDIEREFIDEVRQRPELVALESEIERALAAYFILDFHQSGAPFYLGVPPKGEDCWCLLPQREVGGYRVDFLLVHSTRLELRDAVVIELDGHQWHEKTKEQAARDKARDRYLARHFGKVIHFTGSEIFDDVGQCAFEIMDVYGALHGLERKK
jgi:very-short-patch-repair endonuclease